MGSKIEAWRSEGAYPRSECKSRFGNADRQIPYLIGSISGGDLLSVQGPCTHKWSTSKSNAGQLCFGCFVLSPWLFNYFSLLGRGKGYQIFYFWEYPGWSGDLVVAYLEEALRLLRDIFHFYFLLAEMDKVVQRPSQQRCPWAEQEREIKRSRGGRVLAVQSKPELLLLVLKLLRSRRGDSLGLPPCLCQVLVSLAVLLSHWKPAGEYSGFAREDWAAVGTEASRLSDYVSTCGTGSLILSVLDARARHFYYLCETSLTDTLKLYCSLKSISNYLWDGKEGRSQTRAENLYCNCCCIRVLLLFVKKSWKNRQGVFPGLSTSSKAVNFVDCISLNFLNAASLCTTSYIPDLRYCSDVSSWPVTFIIAGELRPHPIKVKPQEGWNKAF